MSYTYAPKPGQNRLSQPRGRGRGRGQPPRSTNPGNRQSMNNDRYGYEHQAGGRPQNQEQAGAGARGDIPRDNEDKVQHGTGYTMFTPDEKKRRAIAQQAQREEDNYKRYKEKQKLGHVSYVGTVGGGPVPGPSASARRTTSLTQQPKPKKTREDYRAEEKRREDEEYGKKKAAARLKSEQNAERDRRNQERLDNDRRLKNEAFLNRLSRK